MKRKSIILSVVIVLTLCLCIGIYGIWSSENTIKKDRVKETHGIETKTAWSKIIPTSTATPTPLPTPLAVTFENICDYIGRRVTLQGKIFAPFMVSCEYGLCEIVLSPSEEGDIYKDIKIDIRKGTGNNEMEPLPHNWSKADLKIHTNDGQVIGWGELVSVTGWVAESDRDWSSTETPQPWEKCDLGASIISVP